MKNIKHAVVAIGLIFLVGCAGTELTVDQSYAYKTSDSFDHEIIDKANVTANGMAIFEARLDAKLNQLELNLSDKGSRKIEITFTNYHMRHGAARALAGVMAGSDNITSTVIIKDTESDEVIGKLQVVSKNPTATGSARGLIEQHADKIATYIKTGKS